MLFAFDHPCHFRPGDIQFPLYLLTYLFFCGNWGFGEHPFFFNFLEILPMFFKPAVLLDFIKRDSSLRITHEYLPNQIFDLLREAGRHLILTIDYLFVQVVLVRLVKGQIPFNHGEQGHPGGPNISQNWLIKVPLNKLSG